MMNDEKAPTPVTPDRIVDPRSQPHTRPTWRGNLPHLYKEGCTYFVTFNLLDAVSERKDRKRRIGGEDNAEVIAIALEPEPARGSCLLRDPKIASIVEDALLHFQNERYAVAAWCVMPNHVHVVVTPFAGFTVPKILHSWKLYSAHEINKALGRTGSLWEEETFDHLVRCKPDFEKFVSYTERNPVAAGLCDRPEDWAFSSARFRKKVTDV